VRGLLVAAVPLASDSQVCCVWSASKIFKVAPLLHKKDMSCITGLTAVCCLHACVFSLLAATLAGL
jgi:hypothetical protein